MIYLGQPAGYKGYCFYCISLVKSLQEIILHLARHVARFFQHSVMLLPDL